MCATVLQTRNEIGTCTHGDVDVLGTDHGAEFFRCARCEQVLVQQGGRVWFIRRSLDARPL